MLYKWRFSFCKELIINIAGGDKGSRTPGLYSASVAL